jgi:hypothetical protein
LLAKTESTTPCVTLTTPFVPEEFMSTLIPRKNVTDSLVRAAGWGSTLEGLLGEWWILRKLGLWPFWYPFALAAC